MSVTATIAFKIMNSLFIIIANAKMILLVVLVPQSLNNFGLIHIFFYLYLKILNLIKTFTVLLLLLLLLLLLFFL